MTVARIPDEVVNEVGIKDSDIDVAFDELYQEYNLFLGKCDFFLQKHEKFESKIVMKKKKVCVVLFFVFIHQTKNQL